MGIRLPAVRTIWDTDNPKFQGYIPLILALPGLGDTHTRNLEIDLTVSDYSLAGCEPSTVLVAKTDTLGEAGPHSMQTQAFFFENKGRVEYEKGLTFRTSGENFSGSDLG